MPYDRNALSLTYGLKRFVTRGVTPPPPSNEKARIIIGGVSQGFDRKKHATARNIENGYLAQYSRARYNDVNVRSVGLTLAYGNKFYILTKHFGTKLGWLDCFFTPRKPYQWREPPQGDGVVLWNHEVRLSCLAPREKN